MRSLPHIESSAERERVAELLESHGIPVFLGRSGRNVRTAPMFVCIDAQYDDAIALLANPDHEVAEPIDVEAFKRAEAAALPSVLRGAALVLLGVVLVAALVVALLWR